MLLLSSSLENCTRKVFKNLFHEGFLSLKYLLVGLQQYFQVQVHTRPCVVGSICLPQKPCILNRQLACSEAENATSAVFLQKFTKMSDFTDS